MLQECFRHGPAVYYGHAAESDPETVRRPNGGIHMKRTILAIMLVLAAFAAWGQDLAAFQSGFQTFATDMAATLSYNATVGNNWSDAYIGQFPHLGLNAAPPARHSRAQPVEDRSVVVVDAELADHPGGPVGATTVRR